MCQRATHWTHKLFVENADLYLPFLEQAKERAQREAEALSALFTEYGVPSGGRVLDLACGIGRHSVLLSQMGYDVTGLDISPLFIEKAREYAAAEKTDTKFIVGDALDIDGLAIGEKPFDACVNMFTSHSYYGRRGDLAMFGGVARASAEGATLVVMTINRDSLVRRFEPEGSQSAGDVTILESRLLDLETSQMMNTWRFFEGSRPASPRLSIDMNIRVYSLHEMKALLEESGWRYKSGFGSQSSGEISLAPLDLDSSRMWVVAQRRTSSEFDQKVDIGG